MHDERINDEIEIDLTVLLKYLFKYLFRIIAVGVIGASLALAITLLATHDNMLRNVAIGFAAGIVVAIVSILGVLFFYNPINKESAVRVSGSPVIAAIPSPAYAKKAGASLELKAIKAMLSHDNCDKILLDEATPSSIIEAYNRLFVNLSRHLSECECNCVVMASCSESDYFPAIQANAAIAYASSGRKVLLIDADMRAPLLHDLFGVSDVEFGLSDILRDAVDLEKCKKARIRENLDFIPAGTSASSPFKLLASDKLDELMQKVASSYDIVIMNCPPVNSVADAVLVAGNTNGLVLIGRVGSTRMTSFKSALLSASTAKTNIMGLILTGI